MSNLSIQIKVTYASGTITEILIPWDDKAVTAVSYQGDTQTGVETPAKTQEELSAEYHQYVKLEQGELIPSGKRYSSVSEMVESTREKKEEGEVGGEERGCKGREGEVVGKEEEKPDQITFETQSGPYQPDIDTITDFYSAYGEAFVKREFAIAKAWLTANPKKRKTKGGMDRFLNAWLNRAQSRAMISEKKVTPKVTGSLLEPSTDSQEGW